MFTFLLMGGNLRHPLSTLPRKYGEWIFLYNLIDKFEKKENNNNLILNIVYKRM